MAPKTQTFDNPEAAIKNLKKLYANGEISRAEFAREAKKLQEMQLSSWLSKTYGRGRK